VTRPRAARHLAAYVVCRGALAMLGLLPRRVGLAAGRGLGRLFYRLSPGHRRTALDNLRRAFGDALDAPARERIARAAFAHTGMLCADAAYFPRLLRRPTATVAVHEGVRHLRAAAALGRGLLVFSGHFGHWELIALLQHRLGLSMTMVVRPLKNRFLDGFLTRLRRRAGNSVIRKRDATRAILGALRAGGAVAILIDQNVRGDAGIFVEFFGVPASTTPALAALAFRTGAPIVPVFSHPLPDGRVRIVYHPPILPERRGPLKDDIRALTRDCTRRLEEEIRREPTLWMWMHDRWRTRPPAPAAPVPAGAGIAPGAPAAARARAGEDRDVAAREAEARSL
jgi:KDO2-lipid IV(A) lauroyltransferase